MLKEIYIDNYRRFLNSKITFGETVLIAGKNGTGKTTLVELLDKIKRFIVNADSTGYVGELVSVADLPRWQKTNFGQFETHFILDFSIGPNDEMFRYELKIRYFMQILKCCICLEQLSINGEVIYGFELEKNENKATASTDYNQDIAYYVDWAHSGLLIAGRVNGKIQEFIEEVKNKLYVFTLAPDSVIKKTNTTELDISGNNFSRWYSTMLTQNIETAANVLNSYKEFLSNVGRVFINDKGEFTISEKAEGKRVFDIGFSELSAGQQKLCIYYALFKMLPDGSTLIFDEFENHLSPAELQPLYDLAQTEQDERDLQIILASHHRKTLNWYHDSAFVFSLSGLPAHCKIDKFDADNSGVSLEDFIGESE
jgi:AAA15 family ATPase/GTPase